MQNACRNCGKLCGRLYRCNACEKSPEPAPKSADPACPKCGAVLLKRHSAKYDSYFMGCSRFPQGCRYSQPMPGESRPDFRAEPPDGPGADRGEALQLLRLIPKGTPGLE